MAKAIANITEDGEDFSSFNTNNNGSAELSNSSKSRSQSLNIREKEKTPATPPLIKRPRLKDKIIIILLQI